MDVGREGSLAQVSALGGFGENKLHSQGPWIPAAAIEQPVELLSIWPTLAELAGLPIKEDLGRSFARATDEKSRHAMGLPGHHRAFR